MAAEMIEHNNHQGAVENITLTVGILDTTTPHEMVASPSSDKSADMEFDEDLVLILNHCINKKLGRDELPEEAFDPDQTLGLIDWYYRVHQRADLKADATDRLYHSLLGETKDADNPNRYANEDGIKMFLRGTVSTVIAKAWLKLDRGEEIKEVEAWEPDENSASAPEKDKSALIQPKPLIIGALALRLEPERRSSGPLRSPAEVTMDFARIFQFSPEESKAFERLINPKTGLPGTTSRWQESATAKIKQVLLQKFETLSNPELGLKDQEAARLYRMLGPEKLKYGDAVVVKDRPLSLYEMCRSSNTNGGSAAREVHIVYDGLEQIIAKFDETNVSKAPDEPWDE